MPPSTLVAKESNERPLMITLSVPTCKPFLNNALSASRPEVRSNPVLSNKSVCRFKVALVNPLVLPPSEGNLSPGGTRSGVVNFKLPAAQVNPLESAVRSIVVPLAFSAFTLSVPVVISDGSIILGLIGGTYGILNKTPGSPS